MVATSEREAEFVYGAVTSIFNATEQELDVLKIGVTSDLKARMAVTHRELVFNMPDSMTAVSQDGRTRWVGDLEQRILAFCDALGLLYQGEHGRWDGSRELVRFDADAIRVLVAGLGEADSEIREFFDGIFQEKGSSLDALEEELSESLSDFPPDDGDSRRDGE